VVATGEAPRARPCCRSVPPKPRPRRAAAAGPPPRALRTRRATSPVRGTAGGLTPPSVARRLRSRARSVRPAAAAPGRGRWGERGRNEPGARRTGPADDRSRCATDRGATDRCATKDDNFSIDDFRRWARRAKTSAVWTGGPAQQEALW